MTNETHDPHLVSWVPDAHDPETDFPIQNLPYGVFRRNPGEGWRVGVAIGSQVFDLAAADSASLLGAGWADVLGSTLNGLMGQGPARWSALRLAVSRALRADTSSGKVALAHRGLVVPRHEVELRVPADVGDYTDFYASVYHATNVGSMFRPDHPLLPNYKWVPIGYHGRASSIVGSGSPIRRPTGQWSNEPAGPPTFGPSRRLDYEAELGMWIGGGNTLGAPIAIAAAGFSLFGVSLLNDWSARDVQAWEYQPLGPFLAKNFATTVSPWVVTWEALEPFRVPAFPRPAGDPQPLAYLWDEADQARGGLDVRIDVWLASAQMRAAGLSPCLLSSSNTSDLYWTPAQLVAHHTSGGCNLRPGDLLGSGTVSGPTKESRGCLLERAWRGTDPLRLPTGEERRFLEDGDEVTMRAQCTRSGWRTIGLGECRGVVLAANA